MARSGKSVPAADLDLWARYLRGVRPLKGGTVPAPPEIEAAMPAEPKPIAPPPRTAHAIPKPPRAALVATGAAPAGLDRATWTRFRAGRIAPERKLDLHGMTAANAHVAVTALVAAASGQGLRCVEIVTGHGRRSGSDGGVLRREVPLWLNAPELQPMILAVCHPHAANQGSLLVLLRRQRP